MLLNFQTERQIRKGDNNITLKFLELFQPQKLLEGKMFSVVNKINPSTSSGKPTRLEETEAQLHCAGSLSHAEARSTECRVVSVSPESAEILMRQREIERRTSERETNSNGSRYGQSRQIRESTFSDKDSAQSRGSLWWRRKEPVVKVK